MFNSKQVSYKDKLGILLFVISFIFIGIMVWACFKPSIWSDEAFSLLLIQKSYFGIVSVTIADVHPPLYYFILKFVVDLFQVFELSPNSVIILARFVSVVPFILLLSLALFKLRHYFGWLCCGLFAVCLTSMPQLMHYSVEIRMYSWALFFVTVCFIYDYAVIRESSFKNWVILSLFGVCAAYTHYFAAISVIIIFLLLLIYFIFNNKSEFKKWLIAVIMSSSLYFFWLFILIDQLFRVTQDYWIEPLTLNVIINYLWFIFSSSSSLSSYGVLLLASYLILFILFIKTKHNSYEYFSLFGFFILILTVILGILFSVLIKPVFISRYIVPSLGVFWLTFAFLLSKSWNYKKIFIPTLCIVLIVASISSITFVNSEILSNANYNDLNSFLKQDSIKNDDFFLDINENFTADCYYGMQYLLWGYHGLKFGIDSSDNLYPIPKKSVDVLAALKSNKTVWLFSSKEFNLIFKNCTKQNLTIEKYVTYHLDNGGTYDIYKIS